MRANINLKFRGIESTLYYNDIPEEGEPSMYFGYISIKDDKFRISFSGKTIHEAIDAFEKSVKWWLDFGETGEIQEHGKY
jgi:hypothetical protein